ncbi:MAG: Rho termination factor N-terminal domain-containing protein [Candidatus Lokiarchaeia archaeon]
MNREIDDRTYLNFLLQSLNVDDLKQICRDFEIKGFSKFKKSELINFILDSLAEEEFKEFLHQKEIDIISDGINLALKKINGEDRESVAEIKIINPDDHEIELLFKGFNWEVQSYLSITSKNIQNPERDCDCRIGTNMGFCSHFWIGFIYSLKQNWFKLDDWTLTGLPDDFEENIKSIKLIEGQLGEEGEKIKESAVLINETSSGANLMSHLDTSITVYECEMTNIVERESEFQGNITRFFIVSLKDAKFGPKLKKASDFREEDTEFADNLKVRISEKLQRENSLKKGNKISFSGKLVKDNFWGYTVKNVRKVARK